MVGRLFERVTTSTNETYSLAKAFGQHLEDGDFVALEGDLGSGKTLFVKGIAAALGCDPDEVASPTFTLVRQYEGRIAVFHLDLYRLEDTEEELLGIGYEELFEPDHGVTLVEWSDKAASLLPSQRFEVHIAKMGDARPDHRRIELVAVGQPSQRVQSIQASVQNAMDKAIQPSTEAGDTQ